MGRATRLLGAALAVLIHGCTTVPVPVPVQAPVPALDTSAQLVAWWAGEWNNHEQVWQQKLDAADAKVTVKPEVVAHVHTIVAPVAAPALLPAPADAQLLYVQRSQGDDLQKLQGQWLYRLRPGNSGNSGNSGTSGNVALDVFAFNDATRWADAQRKPDGFSTLREADLRALPACTTVLSWDAQTQGYTSKSPGCADVPLPTGLSATWWSSQETTQSVAARSRKARYFEGWLWFRNAGPSAPADSKDTSFTARYTLHAEGQRMPVLHKDGTPSPYVLELAQLTYQNTRKPILKLALIDRSTGKTLSYVWANTEASLIGLNLGWFQAGLTQRAERTYFGY